jgi:hypothetical protein
VIVREVDRHALSLPTSRRKCMQAHELSSMKCLGRGKIAVQHQMLEQLAETVAQKVGGYRLDLILVLPAGAQ